MKFLQRFSWLLAFLFVFQLPALKAQLPSVTVDAGYPVGRPANQVAYGNGKYLLLTSSVYNQLFTSATGLSWSVAPASGLVATQLNFLAFAAGLFVVVGNEGVIQTSPDGITWTSQASGTSNDLYKVYFFNNAFFAIGNNRTLLTSADGSTWTPITFSAGAATDFFVSMAYGNGWFILAARNEKGSQAIVYRSSTGASNSWSYASNVPAWNGTNRIQFLKDRFWAFMIGNRMFTSATGSSWTEVTDNIVLHQPDHSTTTWNNSHQIFNGVWDGTQYSFYGSSQYYGGYGSTFTSADGVNFTLLNKTAYIVPQESAILNGIYFVCGNEGIVSSSDGLTYKHSGYSYSDMVKTAGKYVAVGYISGDGQLYNASEFGAWVNRSPAGAREFYAVAHDGSRLLAGGYTGVYSSLNDGDTWSKVYNNAGETFMALAYGNGRFVAGGYTGTGSFLRYSTNGGTTWTTASSLNNSYLKVRYINNQFFALGSNNDDYNGRILHSADGVTWNDVTPTLGFDVYYFKDVVYDGSKYHVLGVDTDGRFFSVSTATPANAASYGDKAVCDNEPAGVVLGGTWDEGVLTYSGGKFTGAVVDIASGQDYIISSADGSSWTAIPQASYSVVTGAYADGGKVEMIGRGNALFTIQNGNILPVRLLQFDGSLAETGVLLRWSTASEENTTQFTVQHSTNGTAWKTVGVVKAAGSSTITQHYRFTHASPAEGANFYRLLQEDADGKSTHSRVVAVQFGKALRASWYPNPVADRLTIRTASATPGVITIYTSAGQPVKRARISQFETTINMSGLPAGMYLAELRQGNQQQQLTLMKQ